MGTPMALNLLKKKYPHIIQEIRGRGFLIGIKLYKSQAKFIQKLMKQIKDGKTELFVVDDKLGTPTYTYDFANNVELLLEREYWGVYNMVCGGVTGRLEVAKELIRLINKENDIKITPVSSEHLTLFGNFLILGNKYLFATIVTV